MALSQSDVKCLVFDTHPEPLLEAQPATKELLDGWRGNVGVYIGNVIVDSKWDSESRS